MAIEYDEALKASIEYFHGDELSASVFISKYALRDKEDNLLEKTPEDMHHRLAKELARIEAKYPNPLSEKKIFDYLDGFKRIILQGSPMSGIGNSNQLMSLSSCFIIASPFDSYSGICFTDQEEAQIMKRRGGVGFDISTIRPKGSNTTNAAKTTDGIGIFMERFSNTCREVAQGGRRGALMLTISVHHPEIETFLKIKRDLKKVTGANISVKLTDEFMKAVKNNSEYILKWPINNPIISEKHSAKEIWDLIVDSAHICAEPGILFWDTVEKWTPAEIYKDFGFKHVSCNPCQPGWATVLTPEGIKTFDQISKESIIWSGRQWTKVINKVCTGIKPVYAYKTRAGTFFGTENHRIISNGEKIEVKDAETIDISCGPKSNNSSLNPVDIMTGLLYGDGTYHKASNKVFLIIGDKDECYHDSEIKDLIIENRFGVGPKYWAVKTDVKKLEKLPLRSLPDEWIYNTKQEKVCGFLRGLYSANGSIVANRITLKSSCLKLVEQVQLLLSSLGISSYYTTNKAHEVEFVNGIYECKESYDINIGNNESRILFANLIGFIHPDKTAKLNNILLHSNPAIKKSKTTYEIVEKQYLGEELVYDITVEAEEHAYWTSGLLVSNCAELVLSAYDSCRLTLLNAFSYVENPYTKKAKFDFDNFYQDVIIGQRFMDDIIDLEIECIDKILNKVSGDPEPLNIKTIEIDLWHKIKTSCLNGRRTGLGITALGDTIAACGLRYGSPESIELTENISKILALGSYRSSVNMAKERGPFPVFSHALEKGHPFLERIWNEDPELYKDYLKYGRRNIANTTCAPAGSVSTLTQTTSGIEPAFLLQYKRRKKINPNDKNSRVDFVDDLGDKWQEYDVFHHGFKKWMEIAGKTKEDIKDSPYWKSTSADVDWKASVKIQARAQKWTCHSLSKTVNLPANATKELVSDVYMLGHELGCKGLTVYRDGSRSGVLVKKEDETEIKDISRINGKFRTNNAPKRPIILSCDVHSMTVEKEKWTFFVGKLDDKPYEIMGGLSKYITMPKRVKQGKIVKHNGQECPVARYDLHYDFERDPEDETVIKDITNIFDNATHAAFTRTISLALRHGTPVQFLVEQLTKGSERDDDLYSFAKATSRVLKNYIINGTKTNGKCPNCSSVELKYQEGCIGCSCGYSKCN